MSPQFVDFDRDGHVDVVAGTFDGSPHVALATARGYQDPQHVLDGQGLRIVLNQFWNYDTKKWETTDRCDPRGEQPPAGQGTSAFAFDWDADGDQDLLLGDYTSGRLYLRLDDGRPGAPKFQDRNITVMAGGAPIEVGKLGTVRVADWDADGLPDLVVTSMGDSYGKGPGGGVHLFRNTGQKGKPEFAPAVDLLPCSRKEPGSEPQRPDAGLYADLADVDGDGDLDLVVGGYSFWNDGHPQRATFVWYYEHRGSR